MDDTLVSLKLDKAMLARLQGEAKKSNVAIADIVRDAIKRDLRRRKIMDTRDAPGLTSGHDWLMKGIKAADPRSA
ncbi:MAG: ribbon-helix-helix protein, CopG family [Pseudomonadota bacterium]